MTDFEKINQMLNLIEQNKIPNNKTFNEFCIDFFNEVKLIPLSKYLRTIDKAKQMPKIMNTRKAGELLNDTFKNSEVLEYVKKNSNNNEVPELSYNSIMLLRKISLKDNWDKIFRYNLGEKIEDINNSTKPNLLPVEIQFIEDLFKERLKLNQAEYEWFIKKIKIIKNDKELMKNLKKIIK